MRPFRNRWSARAAVAPLLAAACTFGGAPAAGGAAAADGGVRVAELSAVRGDVRLRRPESVEWAAARRGEALRPGDQILTPAGASATVAFDSGSTLAVAPGSLVRIAGAATGVRLEEGAVDVDWRGGARAGAGPADGGAPPGDFVVETRSARARVSREIVFQ